MRQGGLTAAVMPWSRSQALLRRMDRGSPRVRLAPDLTSLRVALLCSGGTYKYAKMSSDHRDSDQVDVNCFSRMQNSNSSMLRDASSCLVNIANNSGARLPAACQSSVCSADSYSCAACQQLVRERVLLPSRWAAA